MIRPIEINAVLNGFVVKVGCQMVVFNSVQTLLNELGAYLHHPETVTRFYRDNAINAKHTELVPAVPPPVPDGQYNPPPATAAFQDGSRYLNGERAVSALAVVPVDDPAYQVRRGFC